MNSGFRNMLDAISGKAEERSFHLPTGEQEPPRICDPDRCKIVACPQRNNPDQIGKPCIYYTEPNTADRSASGITRTIEQAVKEAFQPIAQRLRALESKKPTQNEFNGTSIPAGFPRLYRQSLRGDTIHNG